MCLWIKQLNGRCGYSKICSVEVNLSIIVIYNHFENVNIVMIDNKLNAFVNKRIILFLVLWLLLSMVVENMWLHHGSMYDHESFSMMFFCMYFFLVLKHFISCTNFHGRLKACEIFSYVKFMCEKNNSMVFMRTASV